LHNNKHKQITDNFHIDRLNREDMSITLGKDPMRSASRYRFERGEKGK